MGFLQEDGTWQSELCHAGATTKDSSTVCEQLPDRDRWVGVGDGRRRAEGPLRGVGLALRPPRGSALSLTLQRHQAKAPCPSAPESWMGPNPAGFQREVGAGPPGLLDLSCRDADVGDASLSKAEPQGGGG